MERGRGDLAVYNDASEIGDENVYGVSQKQILRRRGKAVYRIKYRRQVHKKLDENAPKILNIPEEKVKRGE